MYKEGIGAKVKKKRGYCGGEAKKASLVLAPRSYAKVERERELFGKDQAKGGKAGGHNTLYTLRETFTIAKADAQTAVHIYM